MLNRKDNKNRVLVNSPNPFYERVTQGAIQGDWLIQYPFTAALPILEISVGRECSELSECEFYRPIIRGVCACSYCKATLAIL